VDLVVKHGVNCPPPQTPARLLDKLVRLSTALHMNTCTHLCVHVCVCVSPACVYVRMSWRACALPHMYARV